VTHAIFDVAGKAALITGGNSGIARGLPEAIAQAGGDVCCRGTSADKNTAAPWSTARNHRIGRNDGQNRDHPGRTV